MKMNADNGQSSLLGWGMGSHVRGLILSFFTMICMLGMATASYAGVTLHVTDGGTGDGSSWENGIAITDPKVQQYLNGDLFGAETVDTVLIEASDNKFAPVSSLTLTRNIVIMGGYDKLTGLPHQTKETVIKIKAGGNSAFLIGTSLMPFKAYLAGLTLTSGGDATGEAIGIRRNDCPLVIENCKFRDINATSGTTQGGGIGISPSVKYNLTVRNSDFAGCTGRYGGVITANGGSSGTADFENCIFMGNNYTIAPAADNGPFYVRGTMTFKSCLFANNLPVNDGANLFFVASDAGASATLINCTVVNNAGATLFKSNGGNAVLTVKNSIIYGNKGVLSSGTVTVSAVENLINIDPLFGAPASFKGFANADSIADALSADYHLLLGSPAIGIGNNALIAGVDTDLGGDARIQKTVVDMGAYESAFTRTFFAASGASGNGFSWETPGELQSLINVADSNTTIYLTPGEYVNSAGYTVKNGVTLIGGFPKGETVFDLSKREIDPVAPTHFKHRSVFITNYSGSNALLVDASADTCIVDGVVVTKSRFGIKVNTCALVRNSAFVGNGTGTNATHGITVDNLRMVNGVLTAYPARFENCLSAENNCSNSEQGSGVYILHPISDSVGVADFVNCTIAGNNCNGGWWGAVHALHSKEEKQGSKSARFFNSIIIQNNGVANHIAGGAYYNCMIQNNFYNGGLIRENSVIDNTNIFLNASILSSPAYVFSHDFRPKLGTAPFSIAKSPIAETSSDFFGFDREWNGARPIGPYQTIGGNFAVTLNPAEYTFTESGTATVNATLPENFPSVNRDFVISVIKSKDTENVLDMPGFTFAAEAKSSEMLLTYAERYMSGIVTGKIVGFTPDTAVSVYFNHSSPPPEKDADGFYLVKNQDQYGWFVFQSVGDPTLKVKIVGDITITDPALILGLGAPDDAFKGTLEGEVDENGDPKWTITVSAHLVQSKYAGLIAQMGGATVKNIKVRYTGGITIASTEGYIGGIAGRTIASTTNIVDNCVVEVPSVFSLGTGSGNDNGGGGVVGWSNGTLNLTKTKVYVEKGGKIVSHCQNGGLLGRIDGVVTVENCLLDIQDGAEVAARNNNQRNGGFAGWLSNTANLTARNNVIIARGQFWNQGGGQTNALVGVPNSAAKTFENNIYMYWTPKWNNQDRPTSHIYNYEWLVNNLKVVVPQLISLKPGESFSCIYIGTSATASTLAPNATVAFTPNSLNTDKFTISGNALVVNAGVPYGHYPVEVQYTHSGVTLPPLALDIYVNDGSFEIGSASDFNVFLKFVSINQSAPGRLVADLTFEDDFTPIGSVALPYKGIFDGQGHTVRFTKDLKKSEMSFFGITDSATIRNVNVSVEAVLDNSTSVDPVYTGALVSRMKNKSYAENCNVIFQNGGAIVVSVGSKTKYTGGLVGELDASTLFNCSATITASASNSAIAFSGTSGPFNNAAGLVAGTWAATIDSCFVDVANKLSSSATGADKKNYNVAGIVALSQSTTKILNSTVHIRRNGEFSAGGHNYHGNYRIGGLVADVYGGSTLIENCRVNHDGLFNIAQTNQDIATQTAAMSPLVAFITNGATGTIRNTHAFVSGKMAISAKPGTPGENPIRTYGGIVARVNTAGSIIENSTVTLSPEAILDVVPRGSWFAAGIIGFDTSTTIKNAWYFRTKENTIVKGATPAAPSASGTAYVAVYGPLCINADSSEHLVYNWTGSTAIDIPSGATITAPTPFTVDETGVLTPQSELVLNRWYPNTLIPFTIAEGIEPLNAAYDIYTAPAAVVTMVPPAVLYYDNTPKTVTASIKAYPSVTPAPTGVITYSTADQTAPVLPGTYTATLTLDPAFTDTYAAVLNTLEYTIIPCPITDVKFNIADGSTYEPNALPDLVATSVVFPAGSPVPDTEIRYYQNGADIGTVKPVNGGSYEARMMIIGQNASGYVIRGNSSVTFTLEKVPGDKPKHVVLIGVDGLGAQYMGTSSLPWDSLPQMKSIRDRGIHSMTVRSGHPSSSAINWASILTGTSTENHGFNTATGLTPEITPRYKNANGFYPTLFSQMREQRPTTKTACVYNWGGIGSLIDKNAVDSAIPCTTNVQVSDNAIKCWNDLSPEFSFFYFASPDVEGHAKGWGTAEYNEAVCVVDTQIGRILDAIEASGKMDETVVMLISDHGGKGTGHGGFSLIEMEVPFLMFGQGISTAAEPFTQSMLGMDVGATAAKLLDVSLYPASFGRPVPLELNPVVPELKQKAERVVIVGLDGLGANYMDWDMIPNIRSLRDRGAYSTQSRASMESSSAINWASIVMGSGPYLHGYTAWDSATPTFPSRIVNERGIYPTIFSQLYATYPDSKSICVHQWAGIKPLIDFGAVSAVRNVGEKQIVNEFETLWHELDPTLSMLVFDSPDAEGHGKGWGSPEYMAALKRIDLEVGRILEIIRKSGHQDKTMVLLVSDHGGTGTGHGGRTLNELHVPFVVAGPGMKSGETPNVMMGFDAAAVVTDVLGLPVPQAWTARATPVKLFYDETYLPGKVDPLIVVDNLTQSAGKVVPLNIVLPSEVTDSEIIYPDNVIPQKRGTYTVNIKTSATQTFNALDTIRTLTVLGEGYYIAPSGRGDADGTDWENAAPISEIATYFAKTDLHTVFCAGGTYDISTAIAVPSGKTLKGGYDTETGLRPLIDRNGDGVMSPWEFENETIFNITLTNVSAVKASAASGKTVTVDGIHIQNANSNVHGSALFLSAGGAYGVVENCTFSNNRSTKVGTYNEGGTVFCEGNGNTSTLRNCYFYNNSGKIGGALGFDNNTNGSPAFANVQNCVFMNNKAETHGIVNLNAFNVTTATFTDCLFANNSAPTGSAIQSNNKNNTMNLKIYGSTFVKNKSTAADGGALHIVRGTRTLNVDLANNLFWGNEDVNGILHTGGDDVLSDYKLIAANAFEGGWKALSAPQVYTISAESPFVAAVVAAGNTADAAFENGNWRLLTASVLVNSGLNAYVTSALDLDGKPRIYAGRADVGAYENQQALPQSSYYITDNGSGLKTGNDWANAADSTALKSAVENSGLSSILITGGQYKAGSEIFVPAGTTLIGGYNPNGDGTRPLIDRNGDGVVSPWEFEFETFIDGNSTSRCLKVVKAKSPVVLDGLHIIRGFTGKTSGGGAGLSLETETTDAMIVNCTFSYNETEYAGDSQWCGGGAIWITNRHYNSHVTVQNSLFYNNKAPKGSAICNDNDREDKTTSGVYNYILLDGCVFMNNTATSYATVNGITFGHTDYQIQNCLFANNTAPEAAAVFFYNKEGYNENYVLRNSTFVKNKTTTANCSAVQIDSTTNVKKVSIDNCLFWENYTGTTLTHFGTSTSVTKKLFALNHTAVQGGLAGYAAPSVIDIPAESPFVKSLETVGTSLDTMAVLNANWRLLPTALAVDAGDNKVVSDIGLKVDLDGAPRIDTAYLVVDCGAYELLRFSNERIRYVSVTGKGDKDGRDWNNAAPGADSIKVFAADPAVDTICIANGEYAVNCDLTFSAAAKSKLGLSGGFNEDGVKDPAGKTVFTRVNTTSVMVKVTGESKTLCSIAFEDMTFDGKQIQSNSHMLELNAVTISIDRCHFAGNWCKGNYTYCINATNHDIHVRNSSFTDNDSRGSPAYSGGRNVASITVFENCLFAANRNSSSKNGGVLIHSAGYMTISNSIFANNEFSDDGVLYVAYSSAKTLNIYNTTFVNNKSKTFFTTYELSSLNIVSFYNSVFTGNSVNTPASPAKVVNCWSGAIADAGFETATTVQGYDGSQSALDAILAAKWNVTSASKLINRGNNLYVNSSTDMAGAPRIYGGESGLIDLGAYEYPGKGNAVLTVPSATTVFDTTEKSLTYTVDPVGLTLAKLPLTFVNAGIYTDSIALQDNTLWNDLSVNGTLTISPATISSIEFSCSDNTLFVSGTAGNAVTITGYTVEPNQNVGLDIRYFGGSLPPEGSVTFPTEKGTYIAKAITAVPTNYDFPEKSSVTFKVVQNLTAVTFNASKTTVVEGESIDFTAEVTPVSSETRTVTVGYSELDWTGSRTIAIPAGQTAGKLTLTSLKVGATRTSEIMVTAVAPDDDVDVVAAKVSVTLNASSDAPNVRYVSASGSGYKTGWNWENAGEGESFVRTALGTSNVDTVFCAGGVYEMTTASAIIVPTGKTVMGGFNPNGDNTRPLADVNEDSVVSPWEFQYATIFDGKGIDRSCFISDGYTWYNGITVRNAYAKSTMVSDTGKGPANVNGAAIRGVSGNGHCSILNCTFYGNKSEYISSAGTIDDGGIVYIGGQATAGTFSGGTIRNCYFYNNEAIIGAAIFCDNNNNSKNSLIIENCHIVNNKAIKLGVVFLGQFSSTGYVVNVNNCLIANNEAPAGSAIMFHSSRATEGEKYCHITNCTIVNNNNTTDTGTVLQCSSVGKVESTTTAIVLPYPVSIRNSLFNNNKNTLGLVAIRDQDEFPKSGNNAMTVLNTMSDVPFREQTVELTENPFVASIDTVGLTSDTYFTLADWRLKTGTQPIDKGNNDFITVSTDLDANPRIDAITAIVDLGAYEMVQYADNVRFVTENGSGDQTGLSPNHAAKGGAAIQMFADSVMVDTIYVAGGTYMNAKSASASYVIIRSVALIGGWDADFKVQNAETILTNPSGAERTTFELPATLVDGVVTLRSLSFRDFRVQVNTGVVMDYAKTTTLNIESCLFKNITNIYAILVTKPNVTPGRLNVSNSSVIGCNSTAYGLIATNHGNGPDLYFDRCIVVGNRAPSGFTSERNKAYMTNCLFANNETNNTPFFDLQITSPTAGLYATNCTFVNNKCTKLVNASMTVENSLFWNNTTMNDVTEDSNNKVLTASIFVNPIDITGWNGGNLENIMKADWHLKAGSLAVNAGKNDFVSDLNFDLDGHPRIDTAYHIVDVGAYEMNYDSTPRIRYITHGGTGTGTSWGDGASIDSLAQYVLEDSTDTIFMEGGTLEYTPSAAITLTREVAIEGGYDKLTGVKDNSKKSIIKVPAADRTFCIGICSTSTTDDPLDESGLPFASSFRNLTFTGESSVATGKNTAGGGAAMMVFRSGCKVTVEDCEFRDVRVSNSKATGAISIQTAIKDYELILRNSIFSGCRGLYGSVVACRGSVTGKMTVENCSFLGNATFDAAGNQGVITIRGNATFNNCLFAHNNREATTNKTRSLIVTGNPAAGDPSSALLTNCTMVNNDGDYLFACEATALPIVVKNSIVYGNKTNTSKDEAAVTMLKTENMIDINPGFKNMLTFKGVKTDFSNLSEILTTDLHAANSTSLMINRGYNQFVIDAKLISDLDKQVRVFGGTDGIVDFGAYEYQGRGTPFLVATGVTKAYDGLPAKISYTIDIPNLTLEKAPVEFINSGIYTDTVAFAENANWNRAEASADVAINKADISNIVFSCADGAQFKFGDPNSISIISSTVTPAQTVDSGVRYYGNGLEGASDFPTNIGNYTARYTVLTGSANYNVINGEIAFSVIDPSVSPPVLTLSEASITEGADVVVTVKMSGVTEETTVTLDYPAYDFTGAKTVHFEVGATEKSVTLTSQIAGATRDVEIKIASMLPSVGDISAAKATVTVNASANAPKVRYVTALGAGHKTGWTPANAAPGGASIQLFADSAIVDTVYIAEGSYTHTQSSSNVFAFSRSIALIGGYDVAFTTQDPAQYETIFTKGAGDTTRRMVEILSTVTDATITFSGLKFSGYTASSYGIAILNNAKTSTVNISQCRFEKLLGGESIFGARASNAGGTINMTDCFFAGAKTNFGMFNGDSAGGPVFNVNRCQIIGNCFTNTTYGGIVMGRVNVNIYNSLIANNNSPKNIVNRPDGTGNATTVLVNCRIAHNAYTAFTNATGSVTEKNCIFWNNANTSGTTDGNNNIKVIDPLFVNATSFRSWDETAEQLETILAADWHVNAGSYVINRGDKTHLPSGIVKDIDGNARIYDETVGGLIDVGAYEYQGKGNAVMTVTNLSAQYNGAAKQFTYTVDPTVAIPNKLPSSFFNAGTHTDSVAFINHAVWNNADSIAIVTITPADISGILFSCEDGARFSTMDENSISIRDCTITPAQTLPVDSGVRYRGADYDSADFPTTAGDYTAHYTVLNGASNFNVTGTAQVGFNVYSGVLNPVVTVSSSEVTEGEEIVVTVQIAKNPLSKTVTLAYADSDFSGDKVLTFAPEQIRQSVTLTAKVAGAERHSEISVASVNPDESEDLSASKISVKINPSSKSPAMRYISVTGAGYKSGWDLQNAAEGVGALKTFAATDGVDTVYMLPGVYTQKASVKVTHSIAVIGTRSEMDSAIETVILRDTALGNNSMISIDETMTFEIRNITLDGNKIDLSSFTAGNLTGKNVILDIDHCIFRNHIAKYQPTILTEGSQVRIANTRFYGNKGSGGIAYCDGPTAGNLVMDDCLITGNESTLAGSSGILQIRGSALLRNSILANNKTTNSANYAHFFLLVNTSSATLENCTVVNNDYPKFVHVNTGSSFTLKMYNTLVSGNRTNDFSAASEKVGSVTLTETDPGFVSPTLFKGFTDMDTELPVILAADWRLNLGSAAIDAGSNEKSTVDSDYNGEPRINHEIVDAGAHELKWIDAHFVWSQDISNLYVNDYFPLTASVDGELGTIRYASSDESAIKVMDQKKLHVIAKPVDSATVTITATLDAPNGVIHAPIEKIVTIHDKSVIVPVVDNGVAVIEVAEGGTGTGAEDDPVRGSSLKEAVDAANDAVTNNPDVDESVVRVKSGSYYLTETITVEPGVSLVGKDDQPIVIENMTANSALVVGTFTTTKRSIARFNARSEPVGALVKNVIVRNFNAVNGGGATVYADGTLDSCYFENCTAENFGGGVYSLGGTLINVTIENCEAGNFGGGLYVEGGDVRDLRVANCTATSGGGIYAAGIVSKGFFLYGGELSNNTALRSGGGIVIEDSGHILNTVIYANKAETAAGVYGFSFTGEEKLMISLDNCEIRNNTASRMFGGLDLMSGAITNTVIDGNTAPLFGGMSVIDSSYVYNCVISNNLSQTSASNSNPVGGGIYASGVNTLVDSCLIIGNRIEALTGAGAGAVIEEGAKLSRSIVRGNRLDVSSPDYISGGAGLWLFKASADNVLVVGNLSSARAGGVMLSDGSVLSFATVTVNTAADPLGSGIDVMDQAGSVSRIENTVVWSGSGSAEQVAVQANTILNHVAVEAQQVGTADDNVILSTDNSADTGPRFVNPNAGDYQLDDYSVCINRTFMNTVTGTDILNKARIQKGYADIGAYESVRPGVVNLTVNGPSAVTYTGVPFNAFDVSADVATSYFTGVAGECVGEIQGSVTEAVNADTYTVTISSGDENWTTRNSATLETTLVISKAGLIVAAADKSKVYGDANPLLTVSYSGFQNNEDESVIKTGVIAETIAVEASPVGTYPITVNTSGFAADNYIVSAVTPGTLTVTVRVLTVSAETVSADMRYPLPPVDTIVPQYSNLAPCDNGKLNEIVSGRPTFAYDMGKVDMTSPGMYQDAIMVSTVGLTLLSSNYQLATAPGDILVNLVEIKFTIPSQTPITEVESADIPLKIQVAAGKKIRTKIAISTVPASMRPNAGYTVSVKSGGTLVMNGAMNGYVETVGPQTVVLTVQFTDDRIADGKTKTIKLQLTGAEDQSAPGKPLIILGTDGRVSSVDATDVGSTRTSPAFIEPTALSAPVMIRNLPSAIMEIPVNNAEVTSLTLDPQTKMNASISLAEDGKTIVYDPASLRLSDTAVAAGFTDTFYWIAYCANGTPVPVEATVYIGEQQTRGTPIVIPFSVIKELSAIEFDTDGFTRTPFVYAEYYKPFSVVNPQEKAKPVRVSLKTTRLSEGADSAVAMLDLTVNLTNAAALKAAYASGKFTADVQHDDAIQKQSLGLDIHCSSVEVMADGTDTAFDISAASAVLYPPSVQEASLWFDVASGDSYICIQGDFFGNAPTVALEYLTSGVVKQLTLPLLKTPVTVKDIAGQIRTLTVKDLTVKAGKSGCLWIRLPKTLPVSSRLDVMVRSGCGVTGLPHLEEALTE